MLVICPSVPDKVDVTTVCAAGLPLAGFVENDAAGAAVKLRGLPVLGPGGFAVVGREDQRGSLAGLLAEVSGMGSNIRRIDPAAFAAMVPVFRPGYVADAMIDPDAMDIEVHALHHGYLRGLKARGGEIVTAAPVHALARTGGLWTLETPAGAFRVRWLVRAPAACSADVAGFLSAHPTRAGP